MATARVSPDLEMHYVIDDFTDPWREAETVLLLHGNAESGKVWFGWVPHLARHFRVVRPDMRGFGDASGAGGIVGTELAARAAPDGHTVLIGSSTFTIIPGPTISFRTSR